MQRIPAAPALPPDLRELADLWDRLPEAVRSGFLATARALAKELLSNS